ncbi:T9SS type A sorting domain-containing protein [Flavobacteriales bacterium]|nr:T9SS type A sorting domain-containing protein [Flavobacteriales bacterium]
MKKSLLIIPITIALAIFCYPTTSNSNGTGSPGGKTNSAMDGQNCTACHQSTLNSGVGTATITSDIPVNGYVLGNTYTITLTGVKANCIKFGFELTAENGNSKSGNFLITDNTTKLVNVGRAVSHKSSGTSGNTTKIWTMDWTPTIDVSIGNTTFYASLLFANGNGNFNGDNVFTTSLSVNEVVVNGISDNTTQTPFTYNSITKTIETINTVSVYDINGKLVLVTNNKSANISNLKNGIYILKSENKTQKIILN